MSESLDREIQTLQSIYWSSRDPDGLAFAPLAHAHLRKGEVREALDLIVDGTARHPDYATGHVVASRLYFEQGMHGEAEFAARRVLELDGENIVGLSILVSILQQGGEAEADELRDRLVSIDPESEEARAARAPAATPRATELIDDPWAPPAEADAEAAADAGADDAGKEGDGPPPLPPQGAAVASPVGFGLEELTLSDELRSRPVDPEDEPVPLSELAPDTPPPAPEPMDLASLAPDADEQDTKDRAADPIDLAELAPDGMETVEEEPMDLEALAPDGGDEEVEEEPMDLAALAPDGPGSESEDEEPMDLAALAPGGPDSDQKSDDPMELAALAPDAAESEQEGDEAMDLASLAPDAAESEQEGDEPVDLAALAPDGEESEQEGDEALALAALAPDQAEATGSEPEDAPLDPTDPEPDDVDSETSLDPVSDDEASEPVLTRTLAELYVRQGFRAEALGVYRQILASTPDADDVRVRIAELEAGDDGPVARGRNVASENDDDHDDDDTGVSGANHRDVPSDEPFDLDALRQSSRGWRSAEAPESVEVGSGGEDAPTDTSDHDASLEALARDLSEASAPHDVDTPFAWTRDEADDEGHAAEDDGPPIGDYFDALLGWKGRTGP